MILTAWSADYTAAYAGTRRDYAGADVETLRLVLATAKASEHPSWTRTAAHHGKCCALADMIAGRPAVMSDGVMGDRLREVTPGPTPYQRLRAEAASSGPMRRAPRRVYPPEIAKARKAEDNRRRVEARHRAVFVLVGRHQEEFDALHVLERVGVDAERGPMPGLEEGPPQA